MKNIALIFGGKSCESEISTITAISAYNTIKEIYNVYPIYSINQTFYLCDKNFKIKDIADFIEKKYDEVFFANGDLRYVKKHRKSINIYCVLNCCHGGDGENGNLAGFLEASGFAYSSAAPFPSKIFMDKIITKETLKGKGFSVLPYKCYKKNNEIEIKNSYPLIIKPANLGSSIGIEMVHDDEEFYKAIEFAFKFDKKVLVEEALTDFDELNCAAYEANGKIIVSNIEKINYKNDYYDFMSKYIDKSATREVPANIKDNIAEKIKRITYDIYKMFDLKGVIRIDFLVTKDGKIYVNEVNTIPGSLAFYLFRDIVPYHKLIAAIIEEGRRTFVEKEKFLTNFESNFLVGFDEESLNRGVKK